MESLERLCDMLYKEIDEIAQKPNLSSGDLDTVHKLTDTVKNISKIEMLDGRSERGYSSGDSYTRGMSGGRNTSYGGRPYRGGYSRAGEWEARGEYSRDGGMSSGRHYVRGHYSRGDVKEHMISQIEGMLDKADTEETRHALEKCMESLENS